MPNLKPYIMSLRFWLVLVAVTIFTVGVIRASAAESEINIISPTEGETISGNQFTVNLELPQKGVGWDHIHLWLDQANPTATSAIQTTSQMYIFDNVRSGNHTLLVELANTDHTSLSSPATASVNFNTQVASAASGNPSSVLWLSITAFMLVTAALFLLSPKIKPGSGKQPKKLTSKKTRKR